MRKARAQPWESPTVGNGERSERALLSAEHVSRPFRAWWGTMLCTQGFALGFHISPLRGYWNVPFERQTLGKPRSFVRYHGDCKRFDTLGNSDPGTATMSLIRRACSAFDQAILPIAVVPIVVLGL